VTITGERVTTSAGGFNPTWQRHVAAYEVCAELLPPGRVLDLGAGVGHSYELLSPRESVGVDLDARALKGQSRHTVVADMRSLPFVDDSFASILAVHSLEHVPDPQSVVAEASRVVQTHGVAVFVTPNRLTFARPNEIIDPYHYVEFAREELETLCSRSFADVDTRGIFGSARYLELVAAERRKLDALLARDPFRLRRLVPRKVKQRLYDRRLTQERADADPAAAVIESRDFRLGRGSLQESLDLVAICRSPLTSRPAS